VVDVREAVHGGVHHHEVERVQRTDIVQDVGVAVGPHKEQHCKVQSPHHLNHTKPAKVLLNIKEAEVAETSHPHIARNHDTDSIVHLLRMEIYTATTAAATTTHTTIKTRV